MSIINLDFETYSPAGYEWDGKKYGKIKGAPQPGLSAVGVSVYAEHPDAEILSCAYDLNDGRGVHLWTPDMPPPQELFDNSRLISAWNSFFEFTVWNTIATKRYGWRHRPLDTFRCTMARARAYGLPGRLALAAEVLETEIGKDKDGKRLLNKFSRPRNPTVKNKSRRIRPCDDPIDAKNLYAYNMQDVTVEQQLSSRIPELSPGELKFWLIDQKINARGIKVDLNSVNNCIAILEEIYADANYKIRALTGGTVTAPTQVAKLLAWVNQRLSAHVGSLDDDAITMLLQQSPPVPPDVRQALELRQIVGSAAVKKLYAMRNRAGADGRLRELFVYHSARTGRAAGAGVQPQNMPNKGDTVAYCPSTKCRRMFNVTFPRCPWCDMPSMGIKQDWSPAAVAYALESVKFGHRDFVEIIWGDNIVSTISGCLRGMFISSPGKDLICSDYSAIEAVVLAALAGEHWQTEVFRTHGQIYEMTASKITGTPFEEFSAYKKQYGHAHPMRRLGKVAALASGYQSWIGGWKAFGADEFLSDEDIKKSILAWRNANPNIVKFWGGQRYHLHGVEGAAIMAIRCPGEIFTYNRVAYQVRDDILFCKLLSGREIVYHRPRLENSTRRENELSISFEGYNSNPMQGKIGWIKMYTYGGKLTENIVQATARDLLAHAIVNLEHANYPVVLHVHDEIACEVPEDFGSIEEFERIMSLPPAWAEGWPIRAAGGWRAKRYTK